MWRMGAAMGRGGAAAAPLAAAPSAARTWTFLAVLIQHASVTMSCAVLLLAVVGLAGATSAQSESAELSKSAVSDVEFRKSVVYGGAQENDVNPANSAEFLRDFKKVSNETDLEALPSEERPASADGVDRADTGTRVLRGALSHLDTPLFQPFKHNTIDTADFSDCALQGEWKPIGVPNEHYTHHAEDHQREHFHTLTEEPQPHHSIAVSNTHSPLDAEGVAFWNQFVKETNNNLHFMHHEPPPPPPPPRRPNHHHSHHQKKPPPKLRPPQSQKHLHGPPQHRPPPPPAHYVESLDVFQDLRNPASDDSLFTIHQKPSISDDTLLQQSIVSPQQDVSVLSLGVPTDIEHALNSYPPLNSINPEIDLQPDPISAAQVVNSGEKFQDESYLSPPPVPVPHNLHNRPEKPRPQYQRPKFIHRHNRPPPPKFHKDEPKRAPFATRPYQVSEYAEGPVRGGESSHVNSDPSTFTCGHEHGEGTNYHTASYQVEGEADPSLLEHEIAGANHHLAPIIVGQPIFESEGPSSPYEVHSLPEHQEVHQLDLAHDGSGDDSEAEGSERVKKLRPFADKLTSSKSPESSTPSSALETTAPQTFRPEVTPKQHYFQQDSQSAPTSTFHIGFDHSRFSDNAPSHHSNHKPTFETNSNEFNFGNDVEFQKFKESPASFSHGSNFPDSSSFFSSSFGPKFPSGSHKHPGHATSFSEFSFPQSAYRPPKGHQSVFDHKPRNQSSVHKQHPPQKRPKKPYEVSEDSGERVPLSSLFPPKKMPKQFDMRMPNFANPNGRPRPAPPGKPPQVPKNLKSTVHYDGNNLGVYTSHPRNKVTKIRLKMKSQPNNYARHSAPDFRKGITMTPSSHSF